MSYEILHAIIMTPDTLPPRKTIHNLSIKAAKSLLEDKLKQSFNSIEHQAFVFSGELRNLNAAKLRHPKGNIYGAQLADQNEAIELVLRQEDGQDYKDGDVVMLYAAPTINIYNWQAKPQLIVYRITAATGQQVEILKQANPSGIELLKRLKTTHNLFPGTLPIKIAVIYSRASTAQVFDDFRNSLGVVPDVELFENQVSFAKTAELVEAIQQVDKLQAQILVIIRGGGNQDNFKIFEKEEVMQAYSQTSAYRVSGLGHSANNTLLDFISEYSATTPTNAGTHLRQRIMNDLSLRQQANDSLKALNQLTLENRKYQNELAALSAHAKGLSANLDGRGQDMAKMEQEIKELTQQLAISKNAPQQPLRILYVVIAILVLVLTCLTFFKQHP